MVWTEKQEQLLITWAEKASGYAWLHNHSIAYFRWKNRCISIPASVFGYGAGASALLIWGLVSCDNVSANFWGKLLTGVAGIIAGILSNFQEMFTFKEAAEKHRLSALQFLSFFRDISCELSMTTKSRNSSVDYVTMKRLEFDRLLEQSPGVPQTIVERFNKRFKNLPVHKPDAAIGLQTIIPFGKRLRQVAYKKNITVAQKILLLKCFYAWREYSYKKRKSRNSNKDVLIEVANSNNDEFEGIELEDMGMKLTWADKQFLFSNGTLSDQKRLPRFQNIKIRRDPTTACRLDADIKE
jgi:hypothetical protein